MRTYQNQFPRVCWLPRALVACFRLAGWVDSSWGNDACPSFELGTMRCWCEEKHQGRREIPGPRYCVVQLDPNDEYTPTDQILFRCERTADLIRWLLTDGNAYA